MNFEFGMKGYTFGIMALIAIPVNIVLTLLGLGAISPIISIAGLVFAILAFTNGKKELAADPANQKAKTGKTIGLVLIIVQIVFFVLGIMAIVGVGFLASGLLASLM